MTNNNDDTIVAIATAYGQGAVGIVRLSGEGSLKILDKMFLGNFSGESHKMYYGKIHKNGVIVDEVMVCAMHTPRSYTRENVVEIYAHGGMLVLRDVLETAIYNGARLAEPGEFTKRAFLNGRLNLSQAEAVMDIISAGSEAAKRAGLKQLGGGLSRRIIALRDKILMWLAHIELSIDYPEHEEEAKNATEILFESDEVLLELKRLDNSSKVGRILKEGVKTVIAGRPNVGKSTLLNAILREDRAIVHEQAGTTRDVLTEHVVINDVPLLLMDTAGIRETTDPIEKIGVEKSLSAAEEAELILYVIDKSTGFLSDDKEFINKFAKKNTVVLLNKCDIIKNSKDFTESLQAKHILEISAHTGEGLNELYTCIRDIFLSTHNSNDNETIVTNERHRNLISKATTHIQTAVNELKQSTPEDLISIELRAAYTALGELIGTEIGDDIVERIFSEFCVGK